MIILDNIYMSSPKPKMNIVVDPNEHNILKKINDVSSYSGLVHTNDIKNIDLFHKHFKNLNLETYLTGSVVNNGLVNRVNNYNDIDLLVVGDLGDLHAAYRFMSNSKLSLDGKTFKKVPNKKNNNFVVSYINSIVDQRIQFEPVSKWYEFKRLILGESNIDISFAQSDSFNYDLIQSYN